MKKNLFLVTALLLCDLLMPIFTVCLAQEDGNETMLEYSYGTVSSLTPESVTVREYDYELDKEQDVVYRLDPKVELNNVGSLSEVSIGDDIDVYYEIQDGKKIAKTITIEKELPADKEEVGEEEGPDADISIDTMNQIEGPVINEEIRAMDPTQGPVTNEEIR